MSKERVDKRERPRLNLKLNVEFLVEGEEGQTSRMGTTSNVSAGGVYFTTSEWRGLQEGQEMGLRLSGLSGYGTGPLFRNMRAKAKVLRVETPEGDESESLRKAGVAACFRDRPCFEVYRWSE